MNSKADFYFNKAGKWQKEISSLRAIILNCHLAEELKWGVPCYTFQDSNILLIHTFKEYCAVLFFKGVLMKDPKGILIQQTENVQSARQIRFTNAGEIDKVKQTLEAYIYEAVKLEEAGAKVEMKETREFTMPEEFRDRLRKDGRLKKAFEALTPGRQRAYLLHFASAKQSRTRESRIEKCIPEILVGKGLND